jgi:hypothetical protein
VVTVVAEVAEGARQTPIVGNSSGVQRVQGYNANGDAAQFASLLDISVKLGSLCSETTNAWLQYQRRLPVPVPVPKPGITMPEPGITMPDARQQGRGTTVARDRSFGT